jgi:hypothetical protein
MAAREASSRRVLRLKRILRIDAVGVSALVGAALWTSLHRGRSGTRRGVTSVAGVGLAGLGLAVAAVVAVARVDGRGARPHPDAVGDATLSAPRRLIVAGLVVNTVGSAAVIVRHRREACTVTAASVLLIGGDVLSVLYLRRLRPGRAREA